MNKKLFKTLFVLILVVGIISTTALVGYTIHLHGGASILTFIGNEK